jgi:hypothetical protein
MRFKRCCVSSAFRSGGVVGVTCAGGTYSTTGAIVAGVTVTVGAGVDEGGFGGVVEGGGVGGGAGAGGFGGVAACAFRPPLRRMSAAAAAAAMAIVDMLRLLTSFAALLQRHDPP